MNFFLKNKMLSLALLATAIISLVLIVMDVMLYFKFKVSSTEIEENVQKIQTATKKKPAPLQENILNIEADTVKMAVKCRNLQRCFGKFYRIPLVKFAEAIGTNEDEIIDSFRNYYGGLEEEQQGDIAGLRDEEILANFLKLYYLYENEENEEGEEVADAKPGKKDDKKEKDEVEVEKPLTEKQIAAKKKIDEALEQFGKEVKEIAVAYEGNPTSYLLDALGLPRTVQTTAFKREVNKTHEYFMEKQPIPGVVSKEDLEAMTFNADDLPPQREIYMACRELQIKTDIFRRLVKNRLREVYSLDADIPLAGEPIENDMYIKYTYTVKMNGTMDSVRNFINDLSDAYKDNLIYSIRNITMNRPVPEDIDKITGVQDKDNKSGRSGRSSMTSGMPDIPAMPGTTGGSRKKRGSNNGMPDGMMMPSATPTAMPVATAAPKAQKRSRRDKNNPAMNGGMTGMNPNVMMPGMMPGAVNMSGMPGMNGMNGMNGVDDNEPKVPDEYGQPVVGIDRSVDCDLVIDFLMYVGEEVKRVQPEVKEETDKKEKSK